MLKCPYFAAKSGSERIARIRCERYEDNQFVGREFAEFKTSAERAEYMMEYCDSQFNDCPIKKRLEISNKKQIERFEDTFAQFEQVFERLKGGKK